MLIFSIRSPKRENHVLVCSTKKERSEALLNEGSQNFSVNFIVQFAELYS